MMRFTRAALFSLLALVALAGVAGAYPGLSDPIGVPFRHYSTSRGLTSQRDDLTGRSGTAVYNDSAFVTWNSSNTQAALVSDTTAWFSIDHLSVPNFPVFADSIPLILMTLRPGPATLNSPGADTLNFVLQGSMDGQTVAMSAPAIDIFELGTSNTFGRLWNSTRLGAFNGVTATNVNMYGFPFYRIIVKDFTGTTGSYSLSYRYWLDH